MAHGGIVSTLLDEIMAWAVIYFERAFCMTKSISTDFLRPVPIGVPIRARGRLLDSNGGSECRAEGEVVDGDGRLLARATAEFALLRHDQIARLPDDVRSDMARYIERLPPLENAEETRESCTSAHAKGGPSKHDIVFRRASRSDVPVISRLIRELAEYEKLSEHVKSREADLLREGFDDPPRFECILAQRFGEAVGFVLYFHNFSTFEGRSGIYVEDIYVAPRMREAGIGKALLSQLAAIAEERGCPRIELAVLHWNPARDFYRHLGFVQLADWRVYRLAGESLERLALLARLAGEHGADDTPERS